jgi:hypothetical protein
MALGYTTYKTPNAIFTIGSDLSGKEGCGVYLYDQGYVKVATATTDTPYGIVTVGGPSEDGTYAGLIGGSSVEFVDMLGCTVQVTISGNAGVTAGEFVVIDSVAADGTFTGVYSQSSAEGDWLWGLALTNAAAGEQCLMRFQPFVVQYVAPPPP